MNVTKSCVDGKAKITRYMDWKQVISGHWETIASAKFANPSDGVEAYWERERWPTPDEDFIDVDWQHVVSSRKGQSPTLLVLLHGLEGSSSSHYSKALAAVCRHQGWTFAVPHFRSCSGELNWRPRVYHSGDVNEVDWLLQQFRAKHTGRLFVLGVSLGGNALMRWAGEWGSRVRGRVEALAAVCAPLDLMQSGQALCEGFNRHVYGRMFLRSMRLKAKSKWDQFPGSFDLKAALQASDLRAFDDAFTAPLHGFHGVEDYWSCASAKPWLHGVEVPALLLNARNDPFIPACSLPRESEVSNYVTLWQPENGGHVGFKQGAWPGSLGPWAQSMLQWFDAQFPLDSVGQLRQLSTF